MFKRKTITNLTRVIGLGMMLFGLFTVDAKYKLLYSFAGGGEALYSKEGVELMPESIVGYLILSVAGLFIAFIDISLGSQNNNPNQTSVVDEKDA